MAREATPETSEASSYWAKSTSELRHRLAQVIPHETLKELHRPNPWIHLGLLAWQWLLLLSAGAGAWYFDSLLWLPCSVVVGFTLFNFTVMLHEVVHEAVFEGRRARANRWLGYFYAFPSGISATQFTRWHLDHHAQLGDAEADPKRHYLSPKRRARWFKFLYMTVALIPIYFVAARKAAGGYTDDVRRAIARERLLTVLGQLSILFGLIAFAGMWTAFKVYMVPIFVVFPIAFTLNRLGQHYNIDPDDPAKWSTLMKPSRFWDVAFLGSAYHLEHHYFPRVPLYRLRRLNGLLQPFYAEIGLKATTYSRLLWNWFVLNKKAHANWAVPDSPNSPDREDGGHDVGSGKREWSAATRG